MKVGLQRRSELKPLGGILRAPGADTLDAHSRDRSSSIRIALGTVVVIPCYNEAARLRHAEIRTYFLRNRDMGVIFVDDGSGDATSDVLRSLCAEIGPRAALLQLPANRGKAEAVRAGLRAAIDARPQYVAFWDADLATPLEFVAEFQQVLDERPHLLMILGARVRLLGFDIERQAVRHFTGRVFATAASLALRIPVYDTQCGAKMFRVSAEVSEMLERPFMSRWIFDVEILARLLARRRRDGADRPERCMFEFPLPKWEDVRGSKISVRDYARAAVDLARIWWRYSGTR